ncbi:uncharacterized protein [Henckelia pumila]|uniref:uncharacterized protein n=1 Tax=Henckelia pumila TaxID=405737 RepID=UPI003C6E6A14
MNLCGDFSCHNFIQEGLVTKLGVSCVTERWFRVYMGNGQYLWCEKMCPQVPLTLQGHEFRIELYVLPIWGLDIVLGMQWLRTLGPCLHDHEALTMDFKWKQGKGNTLCTLIEMIVEVNGGNQLIGGTNRLPAKGKELTELYHTMFDKPISLPPHRSINHHIHLLPGTTPVSVRPYRYPYFKKYAIEIIVHELLEAGFIKHSTNPSNDEAHFQHLQLVLKLLSANKFFAKLSKCHFFQTTVEYLGHLVSAGRVMADSKKIEAMIHWPIPKNIKQLRGFLGITGYYRHFIKPFSTIAAPTLTDLLKKESFQWTTEATYAFHQLKEAMTRPPSLDYLIFLRLLLLK